MKTRTVIAAIFGLRVLAALSSIDASAQGEPVRVLASNGVKAAFADLSKETEAAIGHPLAAQYAPTTVHRQKIESGEAFEVAILTSDAIDALIREGQITARSRLDVGRSGIGVGVRAGTKKPDIGNPDAIKQTLLNVKAVTYAEDGASRPHIEKMFDSLGITDKMKPKLVLVKGSDASLEAVQSGRADLIITLISEIMPVKGVELIGPLPEKFQSYISFAAGVSASAKSPDAANSLVKFLSGSKAAATFKTKGIQAGK